MFEHLIHRVGQIAEPNNILISCIEVFPRDTIEILVAGLVIVDILVHYYGLNGEKNLADVRVIRLPVFFGLSSPRAQQRKAHIP